MKSPSISNFVHTHLPSKSPIGPQQESQQGGPGDQFVQSGGSPVPPPPCWRADVAEGGLKGAVVGGLGAVLGSVPLLGLGVGGLALLCSTQALSEGPQDKSQDFTAGLALWATGAVAGAVATAIAGPLVAAAICVGGGLAIGGLLGLAKNFEERQEIKLQAEQNSPEGQQRLLQEKQEFAAEQANKRRAQEYGYQQIDLASAQERHLREAYDNQPNLENQLTWMNAKRTLHLARDRYPARPDYTPSSAW